MNDIYNNSVKWQQKNIFFNLGPNFKRFKINKTVFNEYLTVFFKLLTGLLPSL